MRYEKPARLIELALRLGADSEGLTVGEMANELGIGRRTAERMLASLEKLFPQLASNVADSRGTKRWRLPRSVLDGRVSFTAAELAALHTAVALARRDNLPDASAIATLELKVRSLVKPAARAALDTDLEALSQAEGIMLRPGPKPRVDPAVFANLRDAILAVRRARILHLSKGATKPRWQVVSPYGFLYGRRHYLVAFSHRRTVEALRTYALPNISAAEVLVQGRHTPRGFDFRQWASNLFGVYDEPPTNVIWRFSAKVAADAREFEFHPSQKFIELCDGRLEVRFRAGGLLEMAYHLLPWGGAVEVIKPLKLRSHLELLRLGQTPRTLRLSKKGQR